MSDNTDNVDFADPATLRARIAELQVERDEARIKRDNALLEQHKVLYSLEESLKKFAENNLESGDSVYRELSELMVNSGLEGLKRTFAVTVRVSYDFEVEVEASDEDEARDMVDNDITMYARENVLLCDTPDDFYIEVSEA